MQIDDLYADQEWDSMQLPVTRFVYERIENMGRFQYRLDRVLRTRAPFHQTFYYPVDNIRKAVLSTPEGIRALKLFTKMYLPQCNALSLQFQIDNALFSPTPHQAMLSPVRLANSELGPSCSKTAWKELQRSDDLYFSVLALVHSMVQTRNGFFHTGISLLPACTVSAPMWLSDGDLRYWLRAWTNAKMPAALDKSIVAVAYDTGDTRVQSLSENPEIARSMTKWVHAPPLITH